MFLYAYKFSSYPMFPRLSGILKDILLYTPGFLIWVRFEKGIHAEINETVEIG